METDPVSEMLCPFRYRMMDKVKKKLLNPELIILGYESSYKLTKLPLKFKARHEVRVHEFTVIFFIYSVRYGLE
jgi:hypothetical protein